MSFHQRRVATTAASAVGATVLVIAGSIAAGAAQQEPPVFRSTVDLVALNVTVTDAEDRFVT